MTRDNQAQQLILVVEDVHETRYGMEKLLIADGYRVSLARDEEDAIEHVQQRRPDLILVGLPGSPSDVVASAERMRAGGNTEDEVPVVIFCVEGVGEGDEIAVGQNIHLTLPDNFNQLRGLLARLVTRPKQAEELNVVTESTSFL